MRRTSITSMLLILVLSASASACVAGGESRPTPSCTHPIARQACAQNKPGILTALSPACDVLRSQPGRCGMRSFLQLQFVAFHAFEISAPLHRAAGSISVPWDAVIIISSIGSPETDRGPPRS